MRVSGAVRSGRDHERGAMLVVGAMAMMMLLAVAAIVVDLAAARTDRAANQIVADSASTAGAVALAEDGGVEGCTAAVGYVEAHLGATLAGTSCSGFAVSCSALTASATTTGAIGEWTVTITHPVDDGDSLMDPGAIGAGTQAVVGADGDRCERIGVEIREDRATFFAGVLGSDSQSTTIHSVARSALPSGDGRAVNLLLLERHECDAITMSGSGGGVGGIAVGAVTDPVTGEVEPGLLAVDSDGTVGCSSDGTIDVDGSGSVIRADGPPGCPGELSPGTGEGCGESQTLAPGPPGCNLPACSSSGTVAPPPAQVPTRLTRAPVDWRYNCKAAYPVAYDIGGCPVTATSNPYIDQLTTDVGASGTPSGFQSYTGAGHPCTVDGPTDTSITVPQGNWHVDCDLVVKRELTFDGGNIVLDGELLIESSGVLSVNDANTAGYTWTPGTAVDHTEHSADAAYVYMRDGTLTKKGQGALSLNSTMVYLSASSTVAMSGGSGGAVSWTAPSVGPFDDLAMWSEGNADHGFAGQSSLTLEGVFFAPLARITYAGNGSQQQVSAQFISEKLAVAGQGLLVIEPAADRAVLFPEPALSEIVR